MGHLPSPVSETLFFMVGLFHNFAWNESFSPELHQCLEEDGKDLCSGSQSSNQKEVGVQHRGIHQGDTSEKGPQKDVEAEFSEAWHGVKS